MRRILGHLAHFGSFFSQGEVLCTQGLTYLLQGSDAREAFGEHLSKRAGSLIPSDLVWNAEAYQADRGRCDLEGSVDGKPIVKIEAKLSAPFGEGQLDSYLSDLRGRCGSSGFLFVLVPLYRTEEIAKSVSSMFGLGGNGPWRLDGEPDCSVAVLLWEDVLDDLSVIKSEPFNSDLAQFRAMYRVLTGSDIAPITSDADLLRWRDTRGDYENLVDRVTRRLTRQSKLLPMGGGGDYRYRYVCLPLGHEQSCFSIGTRDPIEGYETPIWMRFHHQTPKFSVIHDRLCAAGLSRPMVKSGRDIWIPLDRLLNADAETEVNSLAAQAEEIIKIAYQPLP
jgi:hypothetical protein